MRKISVRVLRLETGLVFSLALYMIVLGITHDKDWEPFLAVLSFSLFGAIGLYVLANGVNYGKRWASAPAILANLIALGVAKYQFEAGLYWVAVPLMLIAGIVIICLIIETKNSYSK